ncbi:kinase-like domain-containing protein [Echria macrotheca]|uniref:Kinase-like domain-containing protein n=1 Tax=Echria macrotheca TaxID=438768 RepID=A0AAJ0F1D9_9PEZI|nr:kinase-like domain-containing protein [Echria macrotheca]
MADAYADDPAQPQLFRPFFWLVPVNSAARKVVEHPYNRYYQYYIDDNTAGLVISFDDPDIRLYTLGSSGADIYLPEALPKSKASPEISDIQASFGVVEETGAVLLSDHSKDRNTEPYSSSGSVGVAVAIKFRSRERKERSVLVARGINTRVAFGRDRFYQFELRWRSDGLYGFDKDQGYALGPKKASSKRYIEKERIGGGAYGAVYEVLDVTSGGLMAVKKFHNLTGKNLEFATREVANLFKINRHKGIHHEHILEIFDSAGGEKGDSWGEVFMPLMQGNLKSLVEQKTDVSSHRDIADTVLRQMLLALQCIASHNIVHRDIKPENILWKYDADGGYHFCLGDFGLSNDPRLAITVAGTEPFMAPEVYHRQKQTTKVDIWSLFATYVWVINVDGFRDHCGEIRVQEVHGWLNGRIAKIKDYAAIRKMASLHAKNRPSAEEQLAILDGEVDLSEEEDEGPAFGVEDDLDTGLEEQFGAVNLEDRGGYGSSGGSQTGSDMPYYEPYTSGLMDSYPWENTAAGPSSVPRGQNPVRIPVCWRIIRNTNRDTGLR